MDLPCKWKQVHKVFNEVLLTPYTEPKFPNQPQNTHPPPITTEGAEDEYEVDEIIDSRKSQGGKMFYKVKWKGYGPHEWSWEPENNVKNAKGAMEEFHNKNPTKPKLSHAWNQKIEIPMTLFPQELFHPLPESLTEPIPHDKPTESMVHCFAQIRVHALGRG